MIKNYIEKIGESRDISKMQRLGEILEELIYMTKEHHHDLYKKYKLELKEMAYGQVIDEETAVEWVKGMSPYHEHWTIEQTYEAMQNLNYNLDKIEFYVVANMMYNDYYNIVKDDVTLALKLAHDWLKDDDAKENKLYNYWKHIIRKN